VCEESAHAIHEASKLRALRETQPPEAAAAAAAAAAEESCNRRDFKKRALFHPSSILV
jgi:hypothetical protein